MTKPLVDIIIPCYHAEDTIIRCANSILAQTFKNWQAVFVVDDATADRTIEVLEQVRAFDDRIVILENNGKTSPAAARNRGIKATGARYVAFLDADDEWIPRKLSAQVELLEATGAYWSDGWFDMIEDTNGFTIHTSRKSKATQTWLVRRSALYALRELDGFIFNERMDRLDDFDLYIRLKKCFRAPITIPGSLCRYHINKAGLTQTTDLSRQVRIIWEILIRNRAWGCLPWAVKIALLAYPVALKRRIV